MSTPSPTQRLLALRNSLGRANDLDVLRHCLGLQQTLNIDPIARQIAEYTVIVSIDAEHWSGNTLEMTELGLCTIARQDLLQIVQAQNFGEHGENVSRAAKFFFFRMLQKSHLQPTNT
jgi:hypothetical protein